MSEDSLLATLPISVLDMIKSYNDKHYLINLNGLKEKNTEYDMGMISAYGKRILEIYDVERKKVIDYEISLETKYTEDESIDIDSLIAYYENKRNGFGARNDERHFNEIKQNKRVFDEAARFIESAKDYYFLQNIIFVIRRFMK